jgi:hypothetical protein
MDNQDLNRLLNQIEQIDDDNEKALQNLIIAQVLLEMAASEGSDDSQRSSDHRIHELLRELQNQLLQNKTVQSELIYELKVQFEQEQSDLSILHALDALSAGKADPVGRNLGAVPLPGSPSYTASIYYYWWLFLSFSEQYKACVEQGGAGPLADLYADFGDIYASSFEDWWKQRGRDLFTYKYETDSKVNVITEQEQVSLTPAQLTVTIPLDGDPSKIIAEVGRLIREQTRSYKSTSRELAPKYQVHPRYTISALHNKALIYRAKHSRRYNNDLELYNAIKSQLSDRDLSHHDDNQKRKFISDEYLAAVNLIQHVRYGRFPDFSKFLPQHAKR